MNVFKNVNISPYSYIKVGGVVDKLYIVKNEENFIQVLNYENNVKLIGQASKILFAFDYDYSSYILDRNDYIKEEKDRIIIGSGTPLNKIGDYFEKRGYEGFSFIRTIPGRLGGSLVQNASCFNECVSDKLIRVKVYFNHRITYKNKEDLAFSYRNSIFKIVPFVILSAEFKKDKKSIKTLKENTKKALYYRKQNTPFDKLNLGSTFINVEDKIVSKLLDELSFKGFYLSEGVKVSRKHANFLEIEKDCSYEQIILLLRYLSSVLYKRVGVFFPLEIIIFKENYFGNKNKIQR